MDEQRRRLKVLYYLTFPGGGITRYAGEFMKAAGGRVEFDVLCPPGTAIEGPGITLHPELAELRGGTRWRSRKAFGLSQIGNPRRLLRAVAELKPDVIHFGNVTHLTYPFWRGALRRGGIPFVATVHDVRRRSSIVNRKFEERQLRRFYRDAAALFVHGPAQKQALIEFAGVDPTVVHIVPHGVYRYPASARPRDLRACFGIPASASVGLQFGYLRDDKHTGRLFRAIARTEDGHLIVAGSRARRGAAASRELRKLAESLGVAERVHLVEAYIPEEEVADYFSAADWVALVYSPDFTSQSGVLCSAVCFRKPVLVAGSPTLKEIVGRFPIGEIAPDSSPAAIAGAIQRLRDARADQWADGFERFESECTWRKNAELTCRVYEDLNRG
jgi:glycosyltransferase involved in cell wall biosynthesis